MNSSPLHRRQQGFTLLEMAVALVVIVLLLGGLLVPLATQIDQQRVAETERGEAQIIDALVGYALATGHLPCPDTGGDGAEDRLAGAVPVNNSPVAGQSTVLIDCAADEGNLPFQTLGVSARDSWGNVYRYRVTQGFSRIAEVHDALNGGGNVLSTSSFALTTPGTLEVCANAACAAADRLASAAVAVVVSRGKNLGNCSTAPSPPACADEIENADGDQRFVRRTGTPSESAAGEFDDVVNWLSPNVLFARMVAAERLP